MQLGKIRPRDVRDTSRTWIGGTRGLAQVGRFDRCTTSILAQRPGTRTHRGSELFSLGSVGGSVAAFGLQCDQRG